MPKLENESIRKHCCPAWRSRAESAGCGSVWWLLLWGNRDCTCLGWRGCWGAGGRNSHCSSEKVGGRTKKVVCSQTSTWQNIYFSSDWWPRKLTKRCLTISWPSILLVCDLIGSVSCPKSKPHPTGLHDFSFMKRMRCVEDLKDRLQVLAPKSWELKQSEHVEHHTSDSMISQELWESSGEKECAGFWQGWGRRRALHVGKRVGDWSRLQVFILYWGDFSRNFMHMGITVRWAN